MCVARAHVPSLKPALGRRSDRPSIRRLVFSCGRGIRAQLVIFTGTNAAPIPIIYLEGIPLKEVPTGHGAWFFDCGGSGDTDSMSGYFLSVFCPRPFAQLGNR